MKKQYISPVCETVEVKVQPLMEMSMTNGNDIGGRPEEGGDGEYGDIGIGGGSHSDFWGD